MSGTSRALMYFRLYSCQSLQGRLANSSDVKIPIWEPPVESLILLKGAHGG